MVDMNGFGGGFIGDLESFKDIIRDSVREVLDTRDMGADKEKIKEIASENIQLSTENNQLKAERELLYEEIQALRDELDAVHFKHTQSEVEPPVAKLDSVEDLPIVSDIESAVKKVINVWSDRVMDLRDASFSVSIRNIEDLNYELENLDDEMTNLSITGKNVINRLSEFRNAVEDIEVVLGDVEKYL